MKTIIKSIILAIFIILPLPCFFLLINETFNSSYSIVVDSNNINIINEYLNRNNIAINGNITKIKLNEKMFECNFELIYDNGNIQSESFSTKRTNTELSEFMDYIIDNSWNSKYHFIALLTIFSTCVSIYLIFSL